MLKRQSIRLGEAGVVAGLVLATGLIFGAVVWQLIFKLQSSDYTSHIQFARNMLEQGEFADVHVMYQVLIIGLTRLLPISFETAAWFVAVCFYTATALILYGLIRSAIGSRRWALWALAAAGALALLFVTPISLLSLPAKRLYFGYVGINVYHNPTIILLKPFALLLFAFTVAILNNSIGWGRRTVLAGWLLVFLALMAKPNYVLVLLPALLVVIAYRLYRRDFANLRTLVVAVVLPGVVLLGAAYYLMFHSLGGGESGIRFAPLEAVYLYEHSRLNLLIKFVMSILFPATVYLLYLRKTVRDLSLNLAWLTFLAGAGQMYLFIETGPRIQHGNFWWGAQIGLFVLFVVSALFWLRSFRERPRWRGLVCFAAFLLHLISGVIFYVLQLQSVGLMDWW